MQDEFDELRKGLDTAFINGHNDSDLAYKPQFISNDYEKGQKVLSSVEGELLTCSEFAISVAFITKSGITPLLQTLAQLESRHIPGKILTTDYLNFSEPEAMDKLACLSNIELRMYRTGEDAGFHTKGYIFKNADFFHIIIGSSNMTMSALTRNKEWNAKLVSTDKGQFAGDILQEFESLWNDEHTFVYKDFIDQYKTAYDISKQQKAIARKALGNGTIADFEAFRLKPNLMQTGFINNMRALIADGADKALLISATGTGKTYASAFALRDEGPKKVLFVVHREQIARQAMASYKRVFGNTRTFALLSGNSRGQEGDYLFATMQMMSKDEVMHGFRPDSFDTIVIDEVHRAGAESYQKIMSYFRPHMWLGMTASPDRTDGFDIYKLFDHNIAYEIRLQQALEENLLCPFHYFGITDITIDGVISDDALDSENEKDPNVKLRHFNYLTSDARVGYIIDKAEYYGHSGSSVKGLIFCSRKDIGQELSAKFNARGLHTVFLSGDDSQDKRDRCIDRLTSDDTDDPLDYIVTVDIFNEGVDIPEINQVIMLRPTESPVIFIQQLGRGLRKADNKEYVVILDFIGNYANNYMIPIALSDDRSYNKDNMRRYVADGTRIIPGSSTIHFDEISRSRIYESIDLAKTQTKRLLVDSYRQLKYRLGRIPDIGDFDRCGSIDVQKIIDYCGSYYNFLVANESDYNVRISDAEVTVIEFLSRKLSKGKRPQELLLLRRLIAQQGRILSYYDAWQGRHTPELESSVERMLTNQFPKNADRKKYQHCVLICRKNNGYCLTDEFLQMLRGDEFSKMVTELIEYGLGQNKKNYSKVYRDTCFELYCKYTYEDVCRLLNWQQNQNAQNLGGYFYDERTHTLPVFINYDKAGDAIAYEDRFNSPDDLIALSKHPRRVSSSDADHFYKRTEADRENRIYLFVRKNKEDNEAKEFYFLGEINAYGNPTAIKMSVADKNGTKTDDAFEINYHLETPVRDDIYEYITG